ncbi:MAG: DAK2 domain-containing protein [Geminicoccaceae bacterium]
MDRHPLPKLIEAMHGTIQSHAAQLDALDEALGDGDHGTNLARAFAALSAQQGRLGELSLAEALARVAEILEREADGDGGRYYGALCRGMGGAATGIVDANALLAMLEAGVKAVQAAGGAAKGDKTLLDVLIPVTHGVRSQIEAGDLAGIAARIVAAAAHGLHGTTHLEAKKGLAAGLGPASVNRIDPGACSCALLFGAAVGVLEKAPQAA